MLQLNRATQAHFLVETWPTRCHYYQMRFFRSILLLTPKGKFFDCATTAFSARYNLLGGEDLKSRAYWLPIFLLRRFPTLC